MAQDLGKKLLAEIEEVGLDEIFEALRLNGEASKNYFGFTPLDSLLQVLEQLRTPTAKTRSTPPILEVASLATGGGKTHLLYYLTALAVLPAALGAKQACAVIIDADCSFSIPRLVQHLNRMCTRHFDSEALAEEATTSSLKHVHIFRPQSLSSTIATLDSLPSYLFNKSKHYSVDRPVAFIALDSVSSFYWQHKADEDDACLLASTSQVNVAPRTLPGYTQLATSLRSASLSFACPTILTSWHLGSAPSISYTQGTDGHSIRPSLPAPISQMPTLRLIVQRIPVRKFPIGISMEEAQREAVDRQRALDECKFEAVVNEWGLEERTLQRLQAVGAGFGFSITADGFNVRE